jgi:hypothetical protein
VIQKAPPIWALRSVGGMDRDDIYERQLRISRTMACYYSGVADGVPEFL